MRQIQIPKNQEELSDNFSVLIRRTEKLLNKEKEGKFDPWRMCHLKPTKHKYKGVFEEFLKETSTVRRK